MNRRNFITSLAAVAGLALIPKRLKAGFPIIYPDYVKFIDGKIVAQSDNLNSLIIYWDNFPLREPYYHTAGVLQINDLNNAIIEFDKWTNHQNKWFDTIIIGKEEYHQLSNMSVLRNYRAGFRGPYPKYDSGIPMLEQDYKWKFIQCDKDSHMELVKIKN